jgi:hypothetical protein
VASTYFSLDLKSHMSAELLKTDEAPMVRRVLSMGRDGTFGQSWRRLQRYMLMIEDPASKARVKPRWADPRHAGRGAGHRLVPEGHRAGLGIAAAAEKILGWDPELVQRAVAEGEAARARVEELKQQGDQAIERMARNLLPVPDSCRSLTRRSRSTGCCSACSWSWSWPGGAPGRRWTRTTSTGRGRRSPRAC